MVELSPDLPMSSEAIQVAGVTRTYGSGAHAVHALRGVSLSIPRGQVLAVVGPSGSGKTTLLNCLVGLDSSSGGTISVFGTDVTSLTYEEGVAWRREQVAIVFQAAGLIGHLSAAENIDIALRLRGVERSERGARIDGALGAMGIAELADHRPAELSGGQRQRVSIARALALRAALLIADEPSGQLDASTTEVVLEELVRPAREHGLTLIMATHDPEVEAIADRSIRLVDGQIEASPSGDVPGGEHR